MPREAGDELIIRAASDEERDSWVSSIRDIIHNFKNAPDAKQNIDIILKNVNESEQAAQFVKEDKKKEEQEQKKEPTTPTIQLNFNTANSHPPVVLVLGASGFVGQATLNSLSSLNEKWLVLGGNKRGPNIADIL
jgi:hypothetical protein